MRQLPRTVSGLIAACLLLAGAMASAQSPLDDYTPVTEQMLVDPPAGDWPMWRRTYNHWGHSPLDQIDTTNVGGLRLAWAWTMAEGLQETTPLVHDGVMFLVQARFCNQSSSYPPPLGPTSRSRRRNGTARCL